jgi:hypothetical protein
VPLQSFAKASALVAQMTLEEKVAFTTGHRGPCEGNLPGLARLGLPPLCLQDGPTGLRFESFVSQFPAAVTVAASFDRELMVQRARALGNEFRARGVHVQLGPVTGGPLGRSPLGGRNWEGPSPDPFLCAEMSYLTVRGIQKSGVITSLKHFIGYVSLPPCCSTLGQRREPSGQPLLPRVPLGAHPFAPDRLRRSKRRFEPPAGGLTARFRHSGRSRARLMVNAHRRQSDEETSVHC